jgi:hypothetical protein
MTRLFLSMGLIAFGLALGYTIQRLAEQGAVRLPVPMDALRKGLQRIALLFFNPVAIVGAVWIVDVGSVRLIALPFLGLMALLAGGVLALLAGRLLRLGPRQKGALFPCGSFTNLGSIGALVCFLFLGERGFALVPIYKLFEETAYYAVGFPIAKYYSTGGLGEGGTAERLRGLLRDPFILAAVTSIALGGALNLSGLERPRIYGTVNAVFVPAATLLLLTSIGLAMRFRKVKEYVRECVSVSLIKFLVVPVLISGAAWLAGFGRVDGGLPLKVVIILSSMPVAFTALIPPSIYDLDLDLANACWLFTTAALAVILPLLMLVVGAV